MTSPEALFRTAVDTSSSPPATPSLPPPTAPEAPALRPESWACEVLHISSTRLWQMLRDGVVDGAALGGRLFVDPATVVRRATEQADQTLAVDAEQREIAAELLTLYLDDHEATGDPGMAEALGAPTVRGRRGSPRRHRQFGVTMHAVVADPATIYDWAVRMRPDLARRMVGPSAWRTVLLSLDGITSSSWITPLLGDGTNRRVNRWIRIDPAHWTIRLDAETAAAVSEPSGAAHVADAAPVAP